MAGLQVKSSPQSDTAGGRWQRLAWCRRGWIGYNWFYLTIAAKVAIMETIGWHASPRGASGLGRGGAATRQQRATPSGQWRQPFAAGWSARYYYLHKITKPRLPYLRTPRSPSLLRIIACVIPWTPTEFAPSGSLDFLPSSLLPPHDPPIRQSHGRNQFDRQSCNSRGNAWLFANYRRFLWPARGEALSPAQRIGFHSKFYLLCLSYWNGAPCRDSSGNNIPDMQTPPVFAEI